MEAVSSAGPFVIEVATGGHPVWCRLKYGQQELHGIHHSELHDLEHAVRRAIVEARAALPASHKHEMD